MAKSSIKTHDEMDYIQESFTYNGSLYTKLDDGTFARDWKEIKKLDYYKARWSRENLDAYLNETCEDWVEA